MRTLLCLATALSLSTSVATPSAEACGGSYGSELQFAFGTPAAFTVSSHFIPAKQGVGSRTRTFVLLGGAAPKDTKWSLLAPRSYDSTQIAPAPQSGELTFTLVGPNGHRVVKGARYVYLARTFDMLQGSSLAIEIDPLADRTYQVALAGTQTTATSQEIESRATTKADVAWVRARGVTGTNEYTSVHVFGDREVLTAWDDATNKRVSIVRQGDREITRAYGWATGIVHVDGRRYFMFTDDGITSLVRA